MARTVRWEIVNPHSLAPLGRTAALAALLGLPLAGACSSETDSSADWSVSDAATDKDSSPIKNDAASSGGSVGDASSSDTSAQGGAGGAAGESQGGAAGESQGGAAGEPPAGTGGTTQPGAGGSAGSPGPTCKQAGGDRCSATAADCAGLFKVASSDCAVCCKVPSNPVFDMSFADPYMVRKGDTYYAFATGSTVRRRSSKDLVSWSPVDSAISSAPWKKADAGFWAPAVYHAKNGKWILYYASERKGATSQHCIGRAVSGTVDGTFVDNDTEPFLCRQSHWSIDPSVFRDNDGKDYLLWRQDTADMPSGNAFIRPLDTNGNLTGVEHLLISRAKAEPSWEFNSTGGVLENPAMIRGGGYHHLFYSGFRWQTAKYANGHAVCDAPFGPCNKTSKENPWLGSTGDMLGPGGADFVEAADGTRFIYMHGWHAPNVGDPDGVRKLWMYRLHFNGKAASIAPM